MYGANMAPVAKRWSIYLIYQAVMCMDNPLVLYVSARRGNGCFKCEGSGGWDGCTRMCCMHGSLMYGSWKRQACCEDGCICGVVSLFACIPFRNACRLVFLECHMRRGLHATDHPKASASVTGSPIPPVMPRSGTCVILGGFGFPNRRCSINNKAMGAKINLLVLHPLQVPVVVPEPPGSARSEAMQLRTTGIGLAVSAFRPNSTLNLASNCDCNQKCETRC